MARKRTLAAAVSAAKQDEAPQHPVPTLGQRRHNPLAGRLDPLAAREGHLAEIASGKVRDVRLRQVDPATCRMWARHDRMYDRLTPANCEDLIASIRAQGRQEVPALVRRLEDDPDGFAYEVVAGARRHYAVGYLREQEHRDIGFLIEVREMADEEAFRYSDIENRARQDISDYERATKYLAALADYYQDSQARMAERMEVSKSLLNAYISLARMPDPVIAAYGDPRGIALRHAQKLSPLLRSAPGALVARAEGVAEAQADAKARGLPPIPPQDVFKLLQGARPRPQASPKPSKPIPYKGASGQVILTAKLTGRRLMLDVDLTARPEEVLAAVRDMLSGDGVAENPAR